MADLSLSSLNTLASMLMEMFHSGLALVKKAVLSKQTRTIMMALLGKEKSIKGIIHRFLKLPVPCSKTVPYSKNLNNNSNYMASL